MNANQNTNGTIKWFVIFVDDVALYHTRSRERERESEGRESGEEREKIRSTACSV